MRAIGKPLLTLTACDLMTKDVVWLPDDMTLRDAAHLLLRNQIGGAPVVGAEGRCIGILSAVDFLRLALRRDDVTQPAAPGLPVTCMFQVKHHAPGGKELTLCTLPPGVCPIQRQQTSADGKEMLVCSEPHCVLTDWQVVDVEQLPTDHVRNFMTTDPVVVKPDLSIRALARMMIDAHIHRVIVVDDEKRPVGIVSSTDVLAALAYAEEQ